jgi:hypothetical protein
MLARLAWHSEHAAANHQRYPERKRRASQASPQCRVPNNPPLLGGLVARASRPAGGTSSSSCWCGLGVGEGPGRSSHARGNRSLSAKITNQTQFPPTSTESKACITRHANRQQIPQRKRRVSQASIERHRPNGAPMPGRLVARASWPAGGTSSSPCWCGFGVGEGLGRSSHARGNRSPSAQAAKQTQIRSTPVESKASITRHANRQRSPERKRRVSQADSNIYNSGREPICPAPAAKPSSCPT